MGLVVRAAEIKGVPHDSLWHAMTTPIRGPARVFACSGVSANECAGLLQRTIVAKGEPEVSKTKMLLGAGHRLLEVDRGLEHQVSACPGVGEGRQLVGGHSGAVEQLAWQNGEHLRTA